MRIGFFTDTYLPHTHGITFAIRSYKEQLEALGHVVYIYAPLADRDYVDDDDHIIRIPAININLFDASVVSLFFPPSELRRIKKLNLDIIHYHTPAQIGLLGINAAHKYNIPLVSTYHTDMAQYARFYPNMFPATFVLNLIAHFSVGRSELSIRKMLLGIRPELDLTDWHERLARVGVGVLHDNTDAVIAPSKKMAAQLKSVQTSHNISIIATGVDALPYKSTDVKKLRQQYSIRSKDLVIGFVGRLGPEKNTALLIEAFIEVAKVIPESKLLMIGDHKYRSELTKMITNAGLEERTIFTGYVDHSELGPYYQLMNIFVFPSTTDTQGLVLNEAAHAGLPLIAVDSTISDVINTSENAIIAKNTRSGLVLAILELLENADQRQQFGVKSREIAAHLTARKQTEKMVRLYERTIQKYHPAAS